MIALPTFTRPPESGPNSAILLNIVYREEYVFIRIGFYEMGTVMKLTKLLY